MSGDQGGKTARNMMLVLEYDGTRYAGFQWQVNGPTIQGEVEGAIERLTGEKVRITAAGRTDAGVHAWGQVVNFRTLSALTPAVMQRGLNALLPADIAVREIRTVDDSFHARFSALRRCYRYAVLNTPVRSPLLRHRAYHVSGALDVEAMHRAAQVLVGTYDFAAFGGPMRDEGTTVRTVYAIGCHRDGDLVVIDIEANAYLSRMVRSIVAILLAVGHGRLGCDDVAAVLAGGDRRRSRPVAPAHGLCLMRVEY